MNDVGERPLVLVALDGSPASATALPVAQVIADQLGAEIAILHIPTPEISLAALRQRLRRLTVTPLPLRLEEAPEPAAGILRALDDPRVILVVLTTHGRTIGRRRGLGHIAEAVIARTTRPVLLVRPETVQERPVTGFHHLLVPLDGTPTTALVLQPAAQLAQRLQASIDLLFVASPDQPPPEEPGSITAPRFVDQPQHEWPAWTSEVIERLGCLCAGLSRDVPVRTYLMTGDIASAILQFSLEHDIDAIVLARRSHLEPGRARVLRTVLADTPCPVFLVGDSAALTEASQAVRLTGTDTMVQ
jgi:nucleotide-binding universal stress UspA family protein